MTTTAYLGKQRLRLDDRDLLGQGGEGQVFRSGDLAIKIFFEVTDARKKKLAAFPTNLPARVVGPQAVVTDGKGNVIGYAMSRLENALDAHQLASRKWRDGEAISQNDVLCTFRDLWQTLSTLHARDIIVGDLNDGNVALTRPLTPWLIDADSLQFKGFPCVVAHERFLDPRLYGIDLSLTSALDRASDTYAFAVLLFSALCFVHPFGGAHASYPTLLRRAEARHSVLRGDVKLPHSAMRPEILDDDLLAWLSDTFDRDRRSAPTPALLEARFTRCSCGVEHARRSCPICSVKRAVPAAVQTLGRLRVTRVPTAPSLPETRVRVEGDWLVRESDSTRIGQVLEGQTHIATGASLGFAFYRAGLVTMFFLFDAHRGPLRQLTLPTLEGRLVEWSVTFDDAHALFCASTTKDGQVRNVAHLVDARGDVLATEIGPEGSSAILSGTTGKCLAGGAVLIATSDGLVLVRADRQSRSFVPLRAFPETRDIVPPEAELRIGPGGSVYVITHDETVHLSFEGKP